MVLDYKGTKFSFKKKKQLQRRRQVTIAGGMVLAVLVVLFILQFIDSRRISGIQDALLKGKVAEATSRMQDAAGGLFNRDAKKELSALIFLFEGKYREAAELFTQLAGTRSRLRYLQALSLLAEKGEYPALETYTDFLLQNKEHEGLLYFKALSRSALLDPQASKHFLEQIPIQEKTKNKKALGILSETNQKLNAGRIEYIFGTNGHALAYYDLKRKQTIPLAPGFDFSPFNDLFAQGVKYYKLTLDLKLQQQIHRLFAKYHGTFILLRLADNAIVASYSKPFGRKTNNAALEELYEAGSIIKVVTLFGYLNQRGQELFPFQCKGNVNIGGEMFYDWLPHKQVDTYEKALAVSCNVAFARMGIGMGKAYLNQCFDDFFFNLQPFEDVFIRFPTGTYDPTASSEIRLARLSVGLEEVKITTLHSALIAAIIAQGGSTPQPHLIDNIKNILDLGFYRHDIRILEVHKDSPAHHRTKQAMLSVQEDENGTGRRAKVDYMLTALKTGTAGNKKAGLDAILMGFFPASKPKYAFAFRLQRAGKAQLEGAYFLKSFLEQTSLIQK